jgi:hypothetical protein
MMAIRIDGGLNIGFNTHDWDLTNMMVEPSKTIELASKGGQWWSAISDRGVEQ